ncbi:PorP/SprF family type IX secretion system membrane protein [Ferruginibacter lapsinanis]|uniref:PorP/SprF family type IX secretion system membrane protein n=1 Tax=Ferruginibacter lapsinanis TaxID=563172 RepID=UPI001E57A5FE|nr:PorP/SprF family type IX secretion system membrane protein [Ferruginibacter lapsinanis]UEG51253.1 PorP/SprF family type IX secretion system membrane protein [Ferruginibacter lapsinanis]
MIRKNTILALCALLFSGLVSAQDPHFSQFFASPLTLNPAFTGKFDGIFRLAANHRDQWPSIPKAYVTTSGSVDFSILKNKISEYDVLGIGFSGLSDQSADNALKLNYGSVSLSFHKAMDEEGFNTLGAGLQATYSSMSLDITKLRFEDQLTANGFTGATNEVLTNGKTQNYLDLNAGLLFSGSSNGDNNYYLGASMYHINKPAVGFIDQLWLLTPRFTIHGGYSTPLSDRLSVHTSAIYQMQNQASEMVAGAAVSSNINGSLENPTNVYAGAWIRLNDAIIPYVGLEFNSLRIGVSYDVNTSSLKAATASRGGSEISLIYIQQKAERGKGIPCPRF